MKLNQKLLRPETDQWVRDGLLAPEAAEAILNRYPASGRNYAIIALAIVGSILCLSGISLLLAHNWQELAAGIKLTLLLLLLGGSAVLAVETQARNVGRTWWECGYLVLGVCPLLGLALISQIFHIQGEPTNLMLLWCAVIAPLPFLSKSVSSFVLWLVAMIAALITLVSSNYLDLRWDDNVYYYLFIGWGAACAVLSMLWRSQPAQRTIGMRLGLDVALLALYALGFNIDSWEILWAVIFAAGLGLITIGCIHHRRDILTPGFFFVGLIVISIFIRLVGSMLNTGLLFLGGGLLLLAILIGFHFVRRSIGKNTPAAPQAQ